MKQILIIEDDKILLEMYQKLLTNHGYEVQTAIDGEEGLKSALQNHPDLILLDITLPKIDGIEVLHTLRGDSWGENADIILLTNLDTNDKILEAITTDRPVYYLVKSNNTTQQVLEKIKEVLDENKEK